MTRKERHAAVAVAVVVVVVGACGQDSGTGTATGAGTGGSKERGMLVPQRTVIGSAKMQADGTIVLDLRHPWAHREIPPSHPEHAGIVAHVGGLTPGQDKPVPPWPDDILDEAVEASLQAHFRSKGIPPEQCSATIEGTDQGGNVLVTVVCGAQHFRLRLRAGSYQVMSEQ